MRFNKEFFKKDFMNKFLSFSFKFGKVFAVITLIVLLITMVCSGIFLLKFDCQKVNTPSFETVRVQIESANSSGSYNSEGYVPDKVLAKERAEKKFRVRIEKMIFENQLKPFAYDKILSNIAECDEKYQNDYVKGLEKFVKEAFDYAKAKNKVNMNNINSQKEFLSGALEAYQEMYERELDRIASEREDLVQQKLIAGGVLLVSLLLFIVCLLIPLLIKIEENTRKTSENQG